MSCVVCFWGVFLRNRSKKFAYNPIIASGNNANILHYIENNKQCKTGELILMDVGAEYANYSSDMTRTIPVSGCYSKRQKDIYNAVLRVKNDATKMNIKLNHEKIAPPKNETPNN